MSGRIVDVLSMNDVLGSIPGWLFIVVVCTWAVWFLAGHLRENLRRGRAVGQTLSEVKREDAPAMFSLQVLGYLLLIGASALIGIGALAAIAMELVR